MMAEISALVNVRWYMGVPFYDTTNFHLEIAEAAEAILGDYLIGLQVSLMCCLSFAFTIPKLYLPRLVMNPICIPDMDIDRR